MNFNFGQSISLAWDFLPITELYIHPVSEIIIVISSDV